MTDTPGSWNTGIGMRISPYGREYLRQRNTEAMPDRCAIYKPTGTSYDPVAKKARPNPPELMYEGPCRLWEVAAGATVILGDDEVTMSQTYFSLPFWVQVPEEDWTIRITLSDDEDLIGRTIHVDKVVRGGGLRASRRMQVTVLSSKKDTW